LVKWCNTSNPSWICSSRWELSIYAIKSRFSQPTGICWRKRESMDESRRREACEKCQIRWCLQTLCTVHIICYFCSEEWSIYDYKASWGCRWSANASNEVVVLTIPANSVVMKSISCQYQSHIIPNLHIVRMPRNILTIILIFAE